MFSLKSLIGDLKQHAHVLFLGFSIFVLSLILKILYLQNLQSIWIYPDSEEYLRAADKLSCFLVDVARLPVYPTFIQAMRSLLFWLPQELAICIGQMILSSMGMLFFFYLAQELFKSYIKALLVTVFGTLSISLMNWDFLILTESLTAFLVILLSLFWVRFVENPKQRYVIGIYLLCILLLFTRPFYIVLPMVLFVGFLLFQFHDKKIKRYLILHAAAMGIVVISVFSYIGLNCHQNGYNGISSVETVNKMGKVLQYNLYELGANDEIKGFIREEKINAGSTEIEPVAFMRKYGLDKDYYKSAAEFSSGIIQQHPVLYTGKTFEYMASRKFLQAAVFTDYNANNYRTPWPSTINALLNNNRWTNNFRFLFLLLFLECMHTLIFMIRRRHDAWKWVGIDVLLLYQILMNLGGSHGEYHRLMMPVYTLIFVMLFRCFYVVWDWITAYLFQQYSVHAKE